MGHCHLHKIDDNMDLVCANFDNRVNSATHNDSLAEGLLYAFVDVEEHGYPPPTELIALAKISEFGEWDRKQHEIARAADQKEANCRSLLGAGGMVNYCPTHTAAD